MSTLPDWLKTRLSEACQVLGVDDTWSINVSLNDRPGSSDSSAGWCNPDPVYLNADIELMREIEDNESGRRHIYHEIDHVAHSDVDKVVYKILDQVPPEDRQFFKELYQEAVEKFIQRQTRAILAAWPKKESNV